MTCAEPIDYCERPDKLFCSGACRQNYRDCGGPPIPADVLAGIDALAAELLGRRQWSRACSYEDRTAAAGAEPLSQPPQGRPAPHAATRSPARCERKATAARSGGAAGGHSSEEIRPRTQALRGQVEADHPKGTVNVCGSPCFTPSEHQVAAKRVSCRVLRQLRVHAPGIGVQSDCVGG